MQHKTVLVRLEEPERLYDREAVLGRDTSSVFPTLASKAAPDLGWAAAAGANAPQFVTEAQLEELKAQRGGTVEDGTVSVDKPLYEVLRENKEKKEEEFQDKWRIMKQGKNKPLEADEVDFLDAVAAHQVEAERRKRAEDAQELESFQLMREQALVKKAVERPHVALPPPQAVTTAPAGSTRPTLTATIKPKAALRVAPAPERKESPKRARLATDSSPPAPPDAGKALLGLAEYSDSD